MKTAPTRTPQDTDKFIVRLPDGLRDELKAVAARNKRSMNAELVDRLEQSLAGRPQAHALSTGDLLDELMLRLGDKVQVLVGPLDTTAGRAES